MLINSSCAFYGFRKPELTAIVWAGDFPMRLKALLVGAWAVGVFGLAAPAFADRRSDAKDQVEFGWQVAMKGLWNEAAFRWEKAVELDPTYAAAWNDLGIAYEQQGKFDLARKAYEKALQIDPNNNFIRQNYDLFREIYDRQNRRRDR
jgi:Tfp pilus assembly protein PilF